MSGKPEPGGKRTALVTMAALLVPALCCGLPALIAAGALGGVGSVIGNPWVIGTAVLLAVAVVAWLVLRHTSASRSGDGSACCPSDEVFRQTRPPASQHVEEA